MDIILSILSEIFGAIIGLLFLVMFFRIWSIIARFIEPARNLLDFFIEGIEDFLKSLR